MTGTPNGKLRRLTLAVCATASIALAASSASALTTVYSISTPGLDDGDACPSGTICSVPRPLEIGGSFAVSGTLTFDDVADTVDISLTLTTASMFGIGAGPPFAETDGIGEIIFTSVTYATTSPFSVFESGTSLFGLGTAAGTAVGTYEQLDGVGAGVVAATGFSEIVDFGNLSCLLNQCGFSVGVGNSFVLPVGLSDVDYDFVHTFNVIIVPEPSAAMMFGIGLLGLVFAGRRRP